MRLNLTQPYFFSRSYSLGVQGQSWHSDEPAFVLDNVRRPRDRHPRVRPRSRSRARRRGREMTLSFTYANEWEDYTISEETLADPTSSGTS